MLGKQESISMKTVRVLFIGDVVGSTGRAMFQNHIDEVKRKYAIDFTVVNGENSTDSGRGINSKTVRFFRQYGADVITSGNHIWSDREIYPYFLSNTDLLRPANFSRENPGVGITIVPWKEYKIAIINLQGRVFMREHVDCPFRAIDTLLLYLKDKTNLIFIDFHAETTSEKMGMGYYVDGRVSGVVGTHTHVQTADERILPHGTAFITDLGMVGALNSMLGMKKEPIIHHFLTQMPVKFEVETTGPSIMTGVCIEVDAMAGKAVRIERIRIVGE